MRVKNIFLSIVSSLMVLGASAIAEASSNIPYRLYDVYKTTANGINIRNNACGATVVAGVNSGVIVYYTGQTKKFNSKCNSLPAGSVWREVFSSQPNPDGGTEYVKGWIADKFLDNIAAVKSAKTDGHQVRVSVNSGTLNLRNGSLSGSIIGQIPNGKELEVITVGSPVTIGGIKRYPTKVKVNINGTTKTGFVDATYLVAFPVWD